ncbi:MAG: monovalent cation/H+ antiporter subunit D family protein [Deltaproteobacteria bacterium]|nr:monovalent cation/H+ antiporter subunit D family protein [Deltaproteobacteria bacterium]
MEPQQTSLIILILAAPLFFSFFMPILGWRVKKLCYPLAALAIFLSLLSSLAVMERVLDQGTAHYYLGGWDPPWGIEFRIDHLNAFMAVLVSFICLVGAIFSGKTVEKDFPEKEGAFYCLFLLLSTGLLGIVLTGDMFNLFVFLEVTSLSGYALIAMGEKRAMHASFRYVLMGTIGASWYLLGVGYLYIVTGSLNMKDLSELLPALYHSKAVVVGFAFVLFGIGIKMALFPLHIWLPDAYTYAPSAVSATVAPLMTKVMIYVILRVAFTVFEPEFPINILHATTVLTWISVGAILFGGVMALTQKDFKRMLCYIIVAEIGYIVGGIGIANATSIKGAVFHILNDALMMMCLFFVAGMVMYRTNGHKISDMEGLFRKMPLAAAVFTIGALAVIGVPPTGGFFSKWYLLLGGIEAKHWGFVAALLISTLINVALFVRVFDKGIYVHALGHASHEATTGPADPLRGEVDKIPLSMAISAFIVILAIFLAGIFNQAILNNIIQFAVPSGL